MAPETEVPGPRPAAIPVDVLTGFLGSGKTTVLRHLLARPELADTAVIVNEFGEVGLDHVLLETSSEDMVLLDSGCLCCTIRGDLSRTLHDLFRRAEAGEIPRFRRVAVETTGLADPAPILHLLMNEPSLAGRVRLDSVIATLDGLFGEATLDRHPEALKQAAVADRLLITKTDLAEAAALDALEARLAALNPAAERLRIAQGGVDPASVFGAGLFDPARKTPEVARWLATEAYADETHAHHRHGDHGHDPNRHDQSIRAFVLTRDEPIDWERLNSWVDMILGLHGRDILRVKGILNVEGARKPVVIHGVQHLFHPAVALEAWPDEDRRSKIVLIVRDLDPALFAHTFEAFLQGPRDPV